jgi:hypothetical protein
MTEYETYEHDRIDYLLDLADTFRASLAIINEPASAIYSRHALPRQSDSLVSVSKDGGVRFNFASRAMVTLLLGDIENMATVADVARARLGETPVPHLHEAMLDEMEDESQKCLDIRYGVEKPSLGAILALGQP